MLPIIEKQLGALGLVSYSFEHPTFHIRKHFCIFCGLEKVVVLVLVHNIHDISPAINKTSSVSRCGKVINIGIW
jgi:hypothetical protein